MRLHVNFQQQCAKWDKTHTTIKNASAPEGRSYIKHAVNLLTILEPIAELHPIAKVVVGCFKQVVLFEQDRQENDARVASVILAQTDMMRVLVDMDRLAEQPGTDDAALQTIANLPEIFRQIVDRINESHNSIDTYYKEHRLVKLYRAQDWKTSMLGYMSDFDAFRVRLHQILSMQVASGVNDLVAKMDILLSRLFAPREPWEIETARQLETVRGDREQWMKDSQTLQALVLATGDTTFNLNPTPLDGPSRAAEGMQGSMAPMIQAKMDLQLERLKDDLQLSLDVLCEKNRDLFTLQLRLHTERLEQAIMLSAKMVIRTLEGPYDRLENEDLRSLWKEMNWFFCVDTKIFSIAIFEYYLDLYSTPFLPSDASTPMLAQEDSAKTPNPSFPSYMPKSNAVGQFKSGSLGHAEAWTLDYLVRFETKIAPLIDTDGSGFIRISEANAFTAAIPAGWTLPQWCAYLVEGRFHESSLYRKRIIPLRARAHEMNTSILHRNQYASMSLTLCIDAFLQYLVLEPRGDASHVHDALRVPVVPELHDLVKQKIFDQDAKLRSKLDFLKWTIRDESTIEVLFGNQPLEDWILPFCCAMMEFVVDIHIVGTRVIMDFKEWLEAGYTPFVILQGIVKRHVQNLKTAFNTDEDIQSYHRGMWSLIDQIYDDDYNDDATDIQIKMAPITHADVKEYYSDLSFQVDFPFPALTGSLLSLRYSTWDEYIKDLDPEEIPSEIPLTWHPIDAELNNLHDSVQMVREAVKEVPYSGWTCDRCQEAPRQERHFHCVVCPDFDLCSRCYPLAEKEHNVGAHTFHHLMLLQCVWVQSVRQWWIALRAEIFLEDLRDKIHQRNVSNIATDIDLVDIEKADKEQNEEKRGDSLKTIHVCAVCGTPLTCGSTPFYHCVEVSCADFSLCDQCLDVRDFTEGTAHIWWHTLLAVDMRTVKSVKSLEVPSHPRVATAALPSNAPIADPPTEEVDASCAFNRDVEARLADVAHSLSTLESKVVSLQTVIREPPQALLAAGSITAGATDDPHELKLNVNTVESTESAQDIRPSVSEIGVQMATLELKINAKMSAVEDKMLAMESKMSSLETKMDDLLKGLAIVVSSLSNR